jgi:hypothetical protein
MPLCESVISQLASIGPFADDEASGIVGQLGQEQNVAEVGFFKDDA